MPRQCRSYKRVRASTGKLVRRCAKYKQARSRLQRHASTPGCVRFKRVFSAAYGKKVWRCAKRRSVTSQHVTTYVTPPVVLPLLAPASPAPSWMQPALPPALLPAPSVPAVETLPPAISPQVLRRLRNQMRRLRPSSMPAATASRWPLDRPRRRS